MSKLTLLLQAALVAVCGCSVNSRDEMTTGADSARTVSLAIDALRRGPDSMSSLRVECFSRVSGGVVLTLERVTTLPYESPGKVIEFADALPLEVVGVTRDGTIRLFHVHVTAPVLGRRFAARHPMEEPQRAGGLLDSATAVRLAIEAMRGASEDKSGPWEPHCVQDAKTGALVTLVPAKGNLQSPGPLGGVLVGVARDGTTGVVAQF